MTMNFSDQEWKKRLSPEQYKILRQKGTEAPGTGKLLKNKDSGDYLCAACNQVVFKSDTKFDSKSGWPSFYEPANTQAVSLEQDDSFGMHRIEVTCSNCGGHLGHLFNDAYDQPTGMVFCINSTSLKFKKQ